MSRIGKQPINLPKGLDVKIQGNFIIAKGSKGELKWGFPSEMKVSLQDRSEERRVGKECRSRWSPYH